MKLLVAIDGSKQSIDAIHALAYFRPPEELILVHALSMPDVNHPMIPQHVRDQVQSELENSLREQGRALMEKTVQELPESLRLAQQVQQIGSPADVILETAQSARVDVILMGARGLSKLNEIMLGSVSHRITLHSPCPTLIVKTPLRSLRKILLPVEGAEDAERALTFLAKKPFRDPVEIQLMIVWPQPQTPWPMTLGQSKSLEEHALTHAQEQLDTLAVRLVNMGYQVTSHVGLGDPSDAILQQLGANKADMIMLGSHGRRGISRFLLGSVSHSILHQADCPVFLLREP